MLDAFRRVLLFSDAVVFDVVDEQAFILVPEWGRQFPTGVGPACYQQEDTHRWTSSRRWRLLVIQDLRY